MINWIIWFWALLCPNPNHTPHNHGRCHLIHIPSTSISTLDTGDETGDGDLDTGGETGNFPPKPPGPPPPPPPPGG